jgi:hypothetical protein
MIELADAGFSIDVPPLGRELLAHRATDIFDAWEAGIAEALPLRDYALRFELVEGSLKGRGTVLVALGAIYMGIANFGSFVSGVESMIRYGYKADTLLLDAVERRLNENGAARMRPRRNAGRLGRLHRLFEQVQRGSLSVDEATAEANRLFDDQDDVPLQFRGEIERALRALPRHPQQLDLPLKFESVSLSAPEGDDGRGKRPLRQHAPETPLPSRYRVEIWKESRTDPRRVTIEPL